MTIDALYHLYKSAPVVQTDTRQITEGCIFFALKGEKFDANQFAKDALLAGAKYAVVDNPYYALDDRYILVDNVLDTLQQLARFHRRQLKIPIIGVTGTNGKTTTKELLLAVLTEGFKAYATKGNLNNHIGVPLTLLAIDETIEIAIIEMGANHLMEIDFLCQIAQPTHGLITNVGKAHLEGFGSFEGVKKTKGELYDFLKKNDGVLFLQSDNEYLAEMASSRKLSQIIRYGFSPQNDIVGKLIVADPLITVAWKEKGQDNFYEVSTQLTGSYNTENILAAIAVGMFFGLTPQIINKGITGYRPTNNRSQITKTSKNTVIADYYNANASSMAAALDNIEVITAEKKVIILGDMFEMGEESFAEHQKVMRRALAITAFRTVFVGKAFFQHAVNGAEFYETTEQAEAMLKTSLIEGSTVLLKASRGMEFERLMKFL